MGKYAVIVAGGSGSRMGGGIPKQFRNLCGRPVLWWSMKAFRDEDPATNIILVLPEEFVKLWQDYFHSLPESDRFSHEITIGGATRTESVKNGLAHVASPDSLVAVHDGARPLVTPELISKGWETAQQHGAAIPVVPVTDSLRKVNGDNSEAVDRSEYVAVQTPQVFKTSILKEAYAQAGENTFTDDAAVVENAGFKVALYPGSDTNFKLTHPKDLQIAAVLCKASGNG